MLKPMKPKKTIPNNIFLWVLVGLLVLSGIIALVSAFSGGDNGEDEVNAVYTNAAATLEAQQLTLEASAPSATPTTITSTPTITVTPLASPTLFPTIASSGGTTGGTGGTGSGAVGCSNSEFSADVTVDDNTVMTPGQAFTKTWRLINTGTCAWTPAYKVTFLSGNAMGGVSASIGTTVQPGQTADISIPMTAPTTAGDARGTWILTNDSGQNFGTTFYVLIKVGAAASTTGTPTATATTAVASAPAAVSDVVVNLVSCTPDGTQYKINGSVTWKDNSDNEKGFKVFLNGSEIFSQSSNAQSYDLPTDTISNTSNPVFGIAAFNDVGLAATITATWTGSCP